MIKHIRTWINPGQLSLFATVLLAFGILFTPVKAHAREEPPRPKVVHPHLSAHQLAAPSIWKIHAKYEASDLTWSPDGRWATYCLREILDHPTHDGGDEECNSLCSIRADGSQARRLDTEEWLSPEIAGWSPDSHRILFWPRNAHSSSLAADGSRLYDVAVTGGKVRLLTAPFRSTDGDRDDWMMREPANLAFSPNGRYLLLVIGGGRDALHNKRLALLSYQSGLRLWKTGPAIAMSEAVWAPDGRHIAFVASPDPAPVNRDGRYNYTWRRARSHLWITGTERLQSRQLTADSHYFEGTAVWAQDSHIIRFKRYQNADDYDEKGSDWEINLDGSGLRRHGSGEAEHKALTLR